jgi:hypothetical protein
MSLYWDLHMGDLLSLTGAVRADITLEAKTGQMARLKVEAPNTVDITLHERLPRPPGKRELPNPSSVIDADEVRKRLSAMQGRIRATA